MDWSCEVNPCDWDQAYMRKGLDKGMLSCWRINKLGSEISR